MKYDLYGKLRTTGKSEFNQLNRMIVLFFAIFLLQTGNCSLAPGDSISISKSTATADNSKLMGVDNSYYTRSSPTVTNANAKSTSTSVNSGLADETSSLNLESTSYAEANAHASENSQANSEANSAAGSIGVALDNSSVGVNSNSKAIADSYASDSGSADSLAESTAIGIGESINNSDQNIESTSEVSALSVAGDKHWDYNSPINTNNMEVVPMEDDFNYLGDPLNMNQGDSLSQGNSNVPLSGKAQEDTNFYTDWASVYTNKNPNTYHYYDMKPAPEISEIENLVNLKMNVEVIADQGALLDPNSELKHIQLPDPISKETLGIKGNVPINWLYTNLVAKDVGMSSQGDIYAAGVDGYLYQYDFLANSWDKVTGNFNLRNIQRVDVSYDGTPYVITVTGDTYYLNCEHKWEKLPGCGRDIAVGLGGEVFKVGCERRPDGFRIYRLVCKYDCKKCSRAPCLRYRKKCAKCYTFKSFHDRKCRWFNMDGGGVRIAVNNDGNPFVIDLKGRILFYDGTDWKNIPNTRAIDLSISNEGMVFYVGSDYGVYALKTDDKSLYDYTNVTYTHLLGQSAFAITSGPYSRPVIVGSGYKIFSSAYAPRPGSGY